MAKIQKELFTRRLRKGQSSNYSQEEIIVSGPNQVEGDKLSCHKDSSDSESKLSDNEKCEGFLHTEEINQQEDDEKCEADLSNDFLDDSIIKTFIELKAEDLEMILNSNDQIFGCLDKSILQDIEENKSTETDFQDLPECKKVIVGREEAKPSWLFCKESKCGFWTRKPERMIRHKLCHTDTQNTLRCPDCKSKFFSLAKLLKHDRICHTGVKDYECRLCNAEVTDIKGHMRIHNSERHLKCNFCTAKFKHRSGLIRHIFLHTGHRPYKCQTCQSFFTGRDRIRDHITRQHSHLISSAENLEKLLDNSRNRERFFSSKHARNGQSSTLQNGLFVSDSRLLTLQTNQQPVVLQLVSHQIQCPYGFQVSPVLQQPAQVLMENQIPSIFIGSDFQNHFLSSSQESENPLEVAMREIV